jgi:PAS domain S-box-containing protein
MDRQILSSDEGAGLGTEHAMTYAPRQEPPPMMTPEVSDAGTEAARALRIIECMPGFAWSADATGKFTYVSPNTLAYLGESRADLNTGADDDEFGWRRTVYPDDYDRVAARWRHCLKTGDHYDTEHRLRRADGVYRWFRNSGRASRDSQGRITEWHGTTMDIDDLKKAEEALRRSERQLRRFVDAVPANLWSTTRDGTPIYRNKRHTNVTGSTTDDPTNAPEGYASPLASMAHPDDRVAAEQVRAHAFATGGSYIVRYRQIRSDGTYRWTESRAEPLRDESGEILQWHGVSVDIHDLVTTQEALRDRERELSQLIDMLPVHIRRLSPDGETIFFNKRLVDFVGMDLAELDKRGMSGLAGTLETFIHPDDKVSLQNTIRHSLATGESYATRYRVLRADGVYRWVEGRGEPLRDQNGTIIQWYGVSIDIDDEMRAQQAEEALRKTSEKLAKATHAASLAELSASIAHEVNQPLAAIVANSHACQRWLKSDPPNLERAQTTVERIIRDAKSAADAVSHIRALFKQAVEPRAHSALDSVIVETRNLMAEEATRRRIRMEIDVAKDIPLLAFDRVQIEQVLINLMRNGLEAMESTAGDNVLRISVRYVGGMVQTAISDSGPGVAFPDRIFEAFFTTKDHGMGMGLAICRSIVESHGGRLWAERNEPHGATFIFTLPVEQNTPS